MGTNPKAPGLWTMPVGDREGSLKALENEIRRQGGQPVPLFDLFRTDNEYTRRIAQAMLRKGLIGSIESRMARMVLVLNSPCPFNKGMLVKDTHFAFLGLTAINGSPLTVAKWLKLHPTTGQPKFYFNSNPWHEGQPHTDVATMQLRWYLMLKDIVPGSTGQTPEEQVAMLPPEYEVPTTIAETTKDILVFRKTDVRPNGSRWAACTERTVKTDKARAGNVSCVGVFDEDGLHVDYWH